MFVNNKCVYGQETEKNSFGCVFIRPTGGDTCAIRLASRLDKPVSCQT